MIYDFYCNWQCLGYHQYFLGHLNKIRISKQKAVGGIWMKNFGKWVLINVWLGLCPYFKRVVPTSGSNRRTVRWYFEWRDPVLVTVQHGDPMRLQGVPHIHCVVTENIGNKVIIYKGSQTPKNKLMIYGLKDRFKTQAWLKKAQKNLLVAGKKYPARCWEINRVRPEQYRFLQKKIWKSKGNLYTKFGF